MTIRPIGVVQVTNRAEVYQADDVTGQDYQIPWVGIGMEVAVFQNFLDDKASGVHGDLVAIVAFVIQTLDVIGLDAGYSLLDEHAPGGIAPVNLWHIDEAFLSEIATETIGVAPFAAVVELGF